METYYKLTQTPSEMEEELKKELSNQNKQQSGDTSTLDDLTEVVGTIKDEIQFLNKAKNTFNEIYKIVEEAHNYLKNLNHETITGLSQTNLKNKLDGYISSIRLAVSNDGGSNFSEELIKYIDKLIIKIIYLYIYNKEEDIYKQKNTQGGRAGGGRTGERARLFLCA